MGLYMDVQSHGFYEGLCWFFFVPLRMSGYHDHERPQTPRRT